MTSCSSIVSVSADRQVAAKKSPPAELSFDDQAEDPQKEHIADEMPDAGMGEDRA